MWIIANSDRIKEAFKAFYDDAVNQVSGELSKIRSIREADARLKDLQEQITKLEIQRDKKEEDYARREREIEHKVGLERKRQEIELELAKKDVALKAREENLKAAQTAFENNMKFMMDRFEKEVSYQRELSEKLLEAMPKMTIKEIR